MREKMCLNMSLHVLLVEGLDDLLWDTFGFGIWGCVCMVLILKGLWRRLALWGKWALRDME